MLSPFDEFDDYGFSLLNIEDLDRDFDPDYDPYPLDEVSSDAILETYTRENPMSKSKNKGNSGKKNRQKQKPKVITNTVKGASQASRAAGKVVATKRATDGLFDYDDDWIGGGALGSSYYGDVSSKAKGGAAVTTGFNKCRHYNTVDSGGLNIKGLTFYPSSMNNQRKGDDLIPDWGLYLDWGWKHPDWRAENIDWRDYGLPSNYIVAFEAMLEVIERAQRGEKVEIGCIGGHGRTGTALACIAVMLGMTPSEAIKHVRSQYCSHTLESEEQEWFVEWVDAQMRGVEAPKMPERKVHKTTGAYAIKGCNQFEHFYMWLREALNCSKKGCSYYLTSAANFDKTVPAYLLGDNNLEWHRKEAKAYRKHPKHPDNVKKPATKSKAFQATSSPVKPVVKPVSQLPPLPTKRKSIVVGDFLVPEPRDILHAPDKRNGCICDVCRYVKAGGEAFLEPFDMQLGAERLRKLDNLEQQAEANIRVRKIQEAQRTPGPESDINKIMIMTPDQGFVEVVVDRNFPKPPNHKGYTTGQKQGDYVWVKKENFWAYHISKG